MESGATLSSHGIRIEPVASHQKADWLPLWRSYQAFYKVAIAEEATNVAWERILDPSEPMNAALAWNGPRAIGLVHFLWHRSFWTTGDYCYLQDLFVDGAVRGGGIGRKLIEHVYHEAQRHGCSRVHWLTHETNTDAMVLYDRIADRSGFLQYRKLL